jgi:hypothetical protein
MILLVNGFLCVCMRDRLFAFILCAQASFFFFLCVCVRVVESNAPHV